jgi:uncharacterized OB-fold protein
MMERTPLPTPSKLTAGFWEAARRHELVIQQCGGCGQFRHYPQHLCPSCWSDQWSWTPVSGSGVIYSYATAHRAFHPAWKDRVPYVVATVALHEGVRMVSDLPPEDTERVAIGLSVELFFEDVPGTEITLPRFRLAASPAL